MSQSELHQQLEGLSAELSRVQEQSQCPLVLDSYIKKLQNAKRKVVVVNNILQNTQVILLNLQQKTQIIKLKKKIKNVSVLYNKKC